MKRTIRPAASEPDTAQAAAFLVMLTRHLADVSSALESADLAVADARRSNRKAVQRRTVAAADDVRAERDELQRQIRALLRRFPALGAQQAVSRAVETSRLADAQ